MRGGREPNGIVRPMCESYESSQRVPHVLSERGQGGRLVPGLCVLWHPVEAAGQRLHQMPRG